jgi:hypothetical protein
MKQRGYAKRMESGGFFKVSKRKTLNSPIRIKVAIKVMGSHKVFLSYPL